MSGEVKLTKDERGSLSFILNYGPGTLPLTKQSRVPAHVSRLVSAGYLEKLNRLRPGAEMYEITPAGLAALSQNISIPRKPGLGSESRHD